MSQPGVSGKQYHLSPELNQQQIQQLLHHTETDPDIHANTSDWTTPEGRPGRFSSLLAFTHWRDQGKTIYTLVDDQENLGGLVWFAHKEINEKKYSVSQKIREKYQTTLGIRLYSEARGQKLAKPFLRKAIHKYLESLGQTQASLWLEVHVDNERAQHLYKSLNFRQAAKRVDNTQDLLVAQLSGKL